MQPTKCPACHSERLAHAPLADLNGLYFRHSITKFVAVHAVACLACGTIAPYLDDAGLNRVREWAGHATQEKAFVEEF